MHVIWNEIDIGTISYALMWIPNTRFTHTSRERNKIKFMYDMVEILDSSQIKL